MPTNRSSWISFAAVSTVLLLAASCAKTSAKATPSLDRLLGLGDTPAERVSVALARSRESQKRVASCMRKAGFEYVEYTPEVKPLATPVANETTLEWRRKHGYGIADMLLSVRDLTRHQSKEPNEVIRAALSPENRSAYDKALRGATDLSATQFNIEGCIAEGYRWRKVVTATASLLPKYRAMEARINLDQRTVGMNRKWSQCMSNQGFRIQAPDEISPIFLVPLQEAATKFSSSGESDSSLGADLTLVIDEVAFERLRTTEIAIAVADAKCTTARMHQTRAEVRAEYEAAFVADNAALLDRVKAAMP